MAARGAREDTYCRFSHPGSVSRQRGLLEFFLKGLRETGFVDGQSVAIEYRWADNRVVDLPALASDLVRREVTVIVAVSHEPAFAAKAATKKVPIVFIAAIDPVKLGLVARLDRPGGNLTGINIYTAELIAKRLEILRKMVPKAARIALLVNPTSTVNTEITVRDAQAAAHSLGLQLQILKANTVNEIDEAFATFEHDRSDALFIDVVPFFSERRVQLANLSSRLGIPAAYGLRIFPEVGGLMSYGSDITDAWRQSGIYTGRILKGEKPTDLPVLQPTKFQLVINANTAKALHLEIPPDILALADEIIE